MPLVISVEVMNFAGHGRPAALIRTSAKRRVQEVTMVQRSGGILASRSREGDDAFEIFDFAALDFAILGGVVGVGQVFADGGEAGASVSFGDDLLGIEAVFERPTGPYAGHGGSGIDEDTIEVEEQGGGVDLGHLGSVVSG